MSKYQLPPLWSAIGGGVSALYGFWPVISMAESWGQGTGWFVLAVAAPFLFLIGMLVVGLVLGFLLYFIDNAIARTLICLVATGIYLAAQSLPHPVWLVLIAVIMVMTYLKAKKADTDASDREEFFNG